MLEINPKKRISLLLLKQELSRFQKRKPSPELYTSFAEKACSYKKPQQFGNKEEIKEQIDEANKNITLSKAYKFLNRFNNGLGLLADALQIFENIYKANDEWDLIDNILKTKTQICN